MKRFIHLDDEEQPLGEVPEAFVFGSWVDEQLDPFVFRITITEQNEFHADITDKQRAAFNKRAAPDLHWYAFESGARARANSA